MEKMQATIGELGLYVIRDKLADRVADPFTAPNNAVAFRGFRQAMQRVIDPESFELIKLGYMSIHDGKICLIEGSESWQGKELLPEPEKIEVE